MIFKFCCGDCFVGALITRISNAFVFISYVNLQAEIKLF